MATGTLHESRRTATLRRLGISARGDSLRVCLWSKGWTEGQKKMHKEELTSYKSRRVRRGVAIAVFIAVSLVCGLWTMRDSRSVEERLAKIEAARAIPDAEDAAIIYNALLTDGSLPAPQEPESLDSDTLREARHHPWSSTDIPELAAWVAKRRCIIDRLAEAVRFEKCRFPIRLDFQDPEQKERQVMMLQWGYLLAFAANNDIAEGRIDQALAEWRCLLQLGNHLRQQPFLFDHLFANATGRLALESIAQYVVMGTPREADLHAIEAMPLGTARNVATHEKELDAIIKLSNEKYLDSLSSLNRLKFHYRRYRTARIIRRATSTIPQDPDRDDITCTGCLRYVAAARGARILIALRRYRSATGHWPSSLDEITSQVPPDTLTDPLNEGSFAYEPLGSTFTLHSKGWNGIDEGGGWHSTNVDDMSIWPPQAKSETLKPDDANDV